MPKKRDTWNYELKRSKKVVYRGTTNDPDRRLAEHAREGKGFTHMNIVGRAKTEASAKRSETKSLATYRRNHGGKNPEYNNKDDG